MAEESSKTLFRCDKTIGDFVSNVIRRYGNEKTEGLDADVVAEQIIREERKKGDYSEQSGTTEEDI